MPLSWLLRLTGQRLILPFYHLVSDVAVPHVDHLYQVKDVRAFEADLRCLLRHFDPLDADDLRAVVDGRRTLRRPAFLLSFDDGLRELYDVVAPVLRREGVPAVCFLNSAFVDNHDLFFRYKASLLTDHIAMHGAPPDLPELLDAPVGLSAQDALLGIGYAARDRLDAAAARVGVDFGAYLRSRQPYLTTPQIRALQSDGFRFGAHSQDHPEYRLVPFEEQVRQTEASVAFVRERFGPDGRLFSFPFTDHGVSRRLFDHLRARGVTDLTFGCAGQKDDPTPRHLQRIPFEAGALTARQILHAELLARLLKMPLGKHVVRHDD